MNASWNYIECINEHRRSRMTLVRRLDGQGWIWTDTGTLKSIFRFGLAQFKQASLKYARIKQVSPLDRTSKAVHSSMTAKEIVVVGEMS